MLLAGDRNTAYTYEEDFTLGSDGLLSIYFAATMDQATVAGIEIKLPAVFRIDAGSTSTFQDELTPQPHVWQADNYFTGSVASCLLSCLRSCNHGALWQEATWSQGPCHLRKLSYTGGLLRLSDACRYIASRGPLATGCYIACTAFCQLAHGCSMSASHAPEPVQGAGLCSSQEA